MKKLIIGLVKLYKLCVSPFLPRACIFEPTCSVYAVQAIDRHGIIRGAGLSIRRILRCNPFSRGGLDPIP